LHRNESRRFGASHIDEKIYKSVSKRLFNLHKKRKKRKVLRKKVMEKSKKSVKKLDINFILNDDSENNRLKSELAVNLFSSASL
jgi:hypothetical protein